MAEQGLPELSMDDIDELAEFLLETTDSPPQPVPQHLPDATLSPAGFRR